MSPTNIHKASSLLSRCGGTFDDQATIQPFGRPVYTIYVEAFPQEVVNKFAELFNHSVEGQWLSSANDPTRVFRTVDPSLPSAIPKLCMSRALKEEPRQSYGKQSENTLQLKEPLDFLIVVQGKNASERSKIVVERSREDAATSMLHEAMNGYSVVFTGALLRSDMNRLLSRKKNSKFRFESMPDLATLVSFSGSEESQSNKQLGIYC